MASGEVNSRPTVLFPQTSEPPAHQPDPQPSGLRRRYSHAVRLCAEATATFFGLSPTTHGAESHKWEKRRADLLRRRFGNARQPSEVASGSLVGTDYPDYPDSMASSYPRSGFSARAAGPPSSLPMVVVQGATPQRRITGAVEPSPAGPVPFTPMSNASFTTSASRQRPPKELTRKESVSSLAYNSLKNAVRRRPSAKSWTVVKDADVLPSPIDLPALPTSPYETPVSRAAFLVGSSPSVEVHPFAVPQMSREAGDQADAAMRRQHFAEEITRSVDEELPPEVPDDMMDDMFYDFDSNFFVKRGMLDHCQQHQQQLLLVPGQVPSRHSQLSAITEVQTESTSSLPSISDEPDVAASVLKSRSPDYVPAVFDDADVVPKLSSLEGFTDAADGFFSAAVGSQERSAMPFRALTQALGRNKLVEPRNKPRNKRFLGFLIGKKEKPKVPTKKPGTFDSYMSDNRAFFTYWITMVDIAIFLFSVISYGFAPIGIDVHKAQEVVMREWGVPQLVERVEPKNPWIGPSQASLVHLGARYAPCMRSDSNINNFIESEREVEEESGCCIRNDRTGCIQSTKASCADALSTWLRWPSGARSQTSGALQATNHTKGPVCGLDPDYCVEPASVPPFVWSVNITQWPICTKPVPSSEIANDVLHMKCDIIGRPCCVGLVGQCILTTREYCEFQKGYFHQEAFLCSQVSCMGDVCGMIPFADDAVPDQFYRLWTSLFLHAGIVHLVISVLVQLTILRHLEKYAGWLRVAIIYFLSGLVGNLASAIFTPYHAEAGPTGSHFGLLACLVVSLVVDIVHTPDAYPKPWLAVAKLAGICLAFFIVGLLPFVDNWAHVFGFAFGSILSCMLLPDIELKSLTRASTFVVCTLLSAGILTALVLLFYIFPVYECEACAYFNCIPFTSTFCATRRIKLPILVK